jgi:uncharacterized protein with von Willebrand factor type A (vWA) domain
MPSPPMPKVAGHVAAFGGVLRSNGLPATPDQTIAFLRAATLLGPRSIRDVYHAAVATFGPEPEQKAAFDKLFRTHFYGDAAEGLSATSEAQIDQPPESDMCSPERGAQSSTGEVASVAELLRERTFADADSGPIHDWGRQLSQRLPRRRSFRMRPSAHGRTMHIRRSLRQLIRNDGDIVRPEMALRLERPRKILILIDVSGSMKALTQDYLRFCHTVVQHAAEVEVFTFATRLSAITPALKLRKLSAALTAASQAVDDWDGGFCENGSALVTAGVAIGLGDAARRRSKLRTEDESDAEDSPGARCSRRWLLHPEPVARAPEPRRSGGATGGPGHGRRWRRSADF